MIAKDIIRLTSSAIISQKMRSFLTALGIAVGISAVVLLTSIGEGMHQYVMSEFSQFGTNIISIQPGKTTTHGGQVGALANVRPLTIDDGQALLRMPKVQAVDAIVQGNGDVEYENRSRRTTIYGTGTSFPIVFKINIASGRFLPADDPRAPRSYVVLGSKVKEELFKDSNPLGARMRVGGNRYRVIGVMESKGQILGIDLDDAVYIPTARALEMFNRESVMEINLLYQEGANVADIVAGIAKTLTARHDADDVTITPQEEMLDVLSNVLGVLTFAVAALGSISLFVGAIGVLTIMTISVNERVAEIGVLRAVGATRSQVLLLFLGEAVALAALGGAAGLVIGIGGAHLLGLLIPALPVETSLFYVVLSEAIAILIGLLSGVVPAQRAANLDPVNALRAE